MTKNDIINIIADKLSISKNSCETIIDSFIDEVKNGLIAGEKVMIKGFMGFEINERSEREGRNPKTGEIVTFPAVKTVKCKVSKTLKDTINGK